MRYVKYLAYSQAQVRVGIGVGVGGGYVAAAPPACVYGYYDYYPYACAPYGYYGPSYFVDGVFVGVGPWYHWGHPAYFWNRGYYGRPGYWGRGNGRPGWGYGRGDFDRDRGYVHGYSGGGFHGGQAFRGGGEFHGGEGVHGGGGFRGGGFHGGGRR